jgi:hypothetical protein
MDFFPTAEKGGGEWSGLVYLCINLYFLQMFKNKYFIALLNRHKTNKNPYENPNLIMDFKNLDGNKNKKQ